VKGCVQLSETPKHGLSVFLPSEERFFQSPARFGSIQMPYRQLVIDGLAKSVEEENRIDVAAALVLKTCPGRLMAHTRQRARRFRATSYHRASCLEAARRFVFEASPTETWPCLLLGKVVNPRKSAYSVTASHSKSSRSWSRSPTTRMELALPQRVALPRIPISAFVGTSPKRMPRSFPRYRP
jgi:hypothetical protein